MNTDNTVTAAQTAVTEAQEAFDKAAAAFTEAQASGDTSAIIDAAVSHRAAHTSLEKAKTALVKAEKDAAVAELEGLDEEVLEAVKAIVGDRAESVHVSFEDDTVTYNGILRKTTRNSNGGGGTQGKYANANVTVNGETMTARAAFNKFASPDSKAKFKNGQSTYRAVVRLLNQQDGIEAVGEEAEGLDWY